MHTICVVHGVGNHTELGDILIFMDRIKSGTSAECIAHRWEHTGQAPASYDPRKGMIFTPMRDFTWEVIMDFTYVVKKMDTLAPSLPVADMYVGHSAGGLIIAGKTDVPLVFLGTPLQLVRNVTVCGTTTPILNIMHTSDPVAAPFDHGKNFVIRGSFWNRINPLSAHTGYWTDKEAANATIEWFKRYVEGK